MYKSRFTKSQASMEFLLILIFVFVIISGLMYIIGNYSLDLKNKEKQTTIKNFVDSILAENQIMLNAKKGYYRELEIPSYLTKKYNLSVKDDYLIVLDLDSVETTNLNFSQLSEHTTYYQLPTSGVTFKYNSTTKIAKFIFQKNNTQDYSNVLIVN